MDALESRRVLLEDLEIIEDAIASRFARNPAIYYRYLEQWTAITNNATDRPSASVVNSNKIYKSKRLKRSKKQIMLQEHEIDLFLRESLQKLKKLASLSGTVDVSALQDENCNFEAFAKHLEEIDDKYKDDDNPFVLDVNQKISRYSMFSTSNSTDHPTTIKSEKAINLQLNKIFTRNEQYGEFMELEHLHIEWFKVIKGTDCTLLQFFNILELFLDDEKYLLEPPMDRKNERYWDFLAKVSSYLEIFFKKSYVLLDHKLLDRSLKKDFHLYLETPIEHVNKGYYSVASSKWIKTQAVFRSYLTGKTHKKNVAKRYDGLFAEFKVHRYLKLLHKEFKHTRDFVERKLAFTAEERIEEMAKLNENYESPDYGHDEKEEEDGASADQETLHQGKKDPEMSIDLPRGPDGLPMPYWLYKLQGLDVTYTCEICGNLSFKGRRAFEKHFTDSTHMFRLRCLGIEPSPTFKGITSIKEALDLSKQVSASNDDRKVRDNSPAVKLEIEVEDDDGNVISKRLYDELKKQGLV